MKTLLKIVAGTLGAALVVAATPAKTYADHRDGEAVAAIIAGVATVGIIAALASHDQPIQVAVHAGYGGPPLPRCAPPPPAWVPGRYQTRWEQVVVPGHWDLETVPAEYGWVRHGWRWEQVLIKPGCSRRVWVPAELKWQETRAWVPAHPAGGPGYARRGDDYGRWFDRDDGRR